MLSKKIGMLFTFLDSALLPQLSNGLYGEGGDGMSVIVKGMEMPQNCAECKMWSICDCLKEFEDYESLLYAVDDGDWVRADECPLVELPPHGRLGDLDALYAEISNGNKAYNGIEGYDGEYTNIANVDDCLEAIKYADTVIEGSET